MRLRIVHSLNSKTNDLTALASAQAHCFELMKNGSFPRFLYRATYVNIGKAELKDRLNLMILGIIMCAIWIPLAFTQPWFKRRHRWCLVMPIFLVLAGLQQIVRGFCPTYALLGYRSLKSVSSLGNLRSSADLNSSISMA